MPEITVHVDHARGLVAIEWPDRPGIDVVDRDGPVRTGRRLDESGVVAAGDRLTLPTGMTRLVDPTPAPAAPARPADTNGAAA